MYMSYAEWFDRSVGNWISHRRYFYGDSRKADNLVTNFSLNKTDDGFTLSWNSDRNEGVMDFVIEGDKLSRSRGYFNNEGTESTMKFIDDDTVCFLTSYSGMNFREEIRLLGSNTRLRQTVGRKGESITLIGQYFEERVD